jgi:hypothetical protein
MQVFPGEFEEVEFWRKASRLVAVVVAAKQEEVLVEVEGCESNCVVVEMLVAADEYCTRLYSDFVLCREVRLSTIRQLCP